MTRKRKNKKICVITLTHNRLNYIKRSFDSLYKRAGYQFDHYVFDDCSDKTTIRGLRKLQYKYKFKLLTSTKHVNVYQNFHQYVSEIPLIYDYYLKLDSDIEILSEDLLLHLLDVFTYDHDNVAGVIPRIEGVLNADRNNGTLNFFNGHAVRIDSPIMFGCCLLLSKHSFTHYLKTLSVKTHTWGIDAEIYESVKTCGHFITVEDVSIYHIDNMYGQRRMHSKYFLNRQRWQNIDVNDTSFMLASKHIYPKYIKTVVYLKLIQQTTTFQEFLKRCKEFTTQRRTAQHLSTHMNDKLIEKELTTDELNTKCQVFKIISPNNFPQIKELTHGTFKYYKTVPQWAVNNPSVCVELVVVTVNEYLRQS